MSTEVKSKVEVVAIDPMKIEQYYFPVNLRQFENLVGKVLTQIEAMNLNERSEKANKDIARQTLWGWWSDAQDNSLTSYGLSIGPIFAPNTTGVVTNEPYQWLTERGIIYEPKTSEVTATEIAKKTGRVRHIQTSNR